MTAGRPGGASNTGVRAEFLPDKYPEFGQCVHKVVQSKRRPERLFLQNHWGLYRSDDRGESWNDIANGVPSDFGFPMAIHPHDPDCAYIVPLESDEFRCTPEGKLRVYRTRNAGARGSRVANGLPQEDAYETVLRDAHGRRCARTGRGLLRHAQRQAVRVGGRRGELERCGRTSAGRVRQGGGRLMPDVRDPRTAARAGGQSSGSARRRRRRRGLEGAVAALEGMPRRARPRHDRAGEVRPHINIFVDGENIRDSAGFATPVARIRNLHPARRQWWRGQPPTY